MLRKKLAYRPGYILLIDVVCLASILLVGCASLVDPGVATAYPTEYLPTVIALTIQAGEAESAVQAGSKEEIATQVYTETGLSPTTTPQPVTPAPPPTETPELSLAGPTVTPYTLPAPASSTPLPEIPNGLIEIRNLGPLSKVTSPVHLYAYMKTGANGRVLIELLGEDNRILYREVKVISYVQAGGSASISMDLDFEIPATAEIGRLRLSIDDEYGRTVALNSVPLVLLSIGDSDIIPPVDVLTPIMIQKPIEQTLIQGGKVLIEGLARPGGSGTLMVRLVGTDGSEVGSRLVTIEMQPESRYGSFAIEVPYNVSRTTPVLLVVTEGAEGINDVIYLASLEIMVSP